MPCGGERGPIGDNKGQTPALVVRICVVTLQDCTCTAPRCERGGSRLRDICTRSKRSVDMAERTGRGG